jgi:PPOX class probable F420-dependent enzyme
MSLLRRPDAKAKIIESGAAMIDLNSEFGRKVKRHLKEDYFIWFTTVGMDLTPQPRPVWFIWENESFLIYSQAQAHKVRHLRTHPKVALHFNADERGEDKVIVFIGTAVINPNELPAHKMTPYLKKYRGGIKSLGSSPEQLGQEYSVAIRVTPTSLRGW